MSVYAADESDRERRTMPAGYSAAFVHIMNKKKTNNGVSQTKKSSHFATHQQFYNINN
jgi:hypothetical protein